MKTTVSPRQTNFTKKVICPPSSFPDTFKDFFQTLNEVDDDNVDILATMLEDKLIPRKPQHTYMNNNITSVSSQRLFTKDMNEKKPFGRRGMSVRHYQRRSSEMYQQQPVPPSNRLAFDTTVPASVSPVVKRRRSSSIAVTRVAPDLNRFLQAEQQPPTTSTLSSRGYLTPKSPSSRSIHHLSPNATPVQNNTPLLQSPTPGNIYQTSTSLSSSNRLLHISPGASPGVVGYRNILDGSFTPSPSTPTRPHRSRTSSMPAVTRHRPMLAEIRRSAQYGGGSGNISGVNEGDTTSNSEDVEYYRLRSFSITANGIYNLGDSLRSRRSRSNTSVTSTGTSGSGGSYRDRNLSSASQASSNGGDSVSTAATITNEKENNITSYKVALLGASGVGKTALNYQFTTSEYICAYDASLDEEYGQKTVSVMLDGVETELEIIDHPASEMSIESFCATYHVDMFVIVYSIVDRKTFSVAEDMLTYLAKNEYIATKGVILVGNKADLERKREVPLVVGRRLANSFGCKFIETSSGLDHNVDELLVGILAQVKLNPKRDRNHMHRKRRHKSKMGSSRKILRHLLGFKRKTKSCENLFVL